VKGKSTQKELRQLLQSTRENKNPSMWSQFSWEDVLMDNTWARGAAQLAGKERVFYPEFFEGQAGKSRSATASILAGRLAATPSAEAQNKLNDMLGEANAITLGGAAEKIYRITQEYGQKFEDLNELWKGGRLGSEAERLAAMHKLDAARQAEIARATETKTGKSLGLPQVSAFEKMGLMMGGPGVGGISDVYRDTANNTKQAVVVLREIVKKLEPNTGSFANR
jgi:hypothetical protein